MRYLKIELYNKFLERTGVLGNFVRAEVADRWLGAGYATIEVEATDDKLPQILEDGARAVVRVVDEADPNSIGRFVMSGYISDPEGGFLARETVTFKIVDDWQAWLSMLAYVNPTGRIQPISTDDIAQTTVPAGVTTPSPGRVDGLASRYSWTNNGAPIQASTAAQELFTQNVRLRAEARFPGLIVQAADPGIGGDVSAILPELRFDTVAEGIAPLLEAGNVGYQFGQSVEGGASILGEFYTPKTWEPIFTPDSGVVVGGKWNLQYGRTTDVVGGGPGQDARRAFRLYQDLALSQQYRRIHEQFKDMTGAPVDWPDTVAEPFRVEMYYHLRPEVTAVQKGLFEAFLTKSGNAALSEGAPSAGVSLELAETEGFRWQGVLGGVFDGSGKTGFATGDIITVAPSLDSAVSGLRFTDRIRSTRFEQTREAGLVITPQMGAPMDDQAQKLVSIVQRIAAANNRSARDK